jgi:hypothetical protein
MHIKLSFSYVITFLLLVIVMLEVHETVHITVGRFICGCWGPRDFNVWSLCAGCAENYSFWWLATLAGPLVSFALMWLGMSWLSTEESGKSALGFSLIFANIPFGRISTVMMGGGDEMVVARHLLRQDFSRIQILLMCSFVVLCFVVPPVSKAFRLLNNRRSWIYLVGFLTLPLAFLLIYVLTGLNFLLTQGFLLTPWIMGTPVLITLHTSIALFSLAWFRKNLYQLLKR